MHKPDFDDFADETDLVELIELFEHFIETKEQHFFDEEALERILGFYEMRHDFEKMELVANYAIEQNPYSSEFLIRKAELLLQKKEYTACLEWLEKANILDSRDIDIYLIKSDVFIETNAIDAAREILEYALQVVDTDEHDVIYAQLCDIFEMKEDFESAYEVLEKALTLNPQSEDALHKTAHIVDMTDKFEESILLHTKILEKDPYLWLAWYNLGRAYTGIGLFEKAIEAFEFVNAINEDYDLAYREAAEVYYRKEEFDKAIRMFETAHEKSGGFEDYSFRIGLCYERMERLKEARFQYRKSVRFDPFLDEALFRIGETYRLEGRYEAAIVNYKKALKIDEENDFYLTALIRLYQKTDRPEEALLYQRRLVNCRADVPGYWVDLIEWLYLYEAFSEALEVITDAFNRCGAFVEFYYLQSLLLWRTGKHKESLGALEHALTTDNKHFGMLIDLDAEFCQLPDVLALVHLYKN